MMPPGHTVSGWGALCSLVISNVQIFTTGDKFHVQTLLALSWLSVPRRWMICPLSSAGEGAASTIRT